MSNIGEVTSERRKAWTLTPGSFQRLLNWLDGGVSSDGQRYIVVRRRLRDYFARKGCLAPDDLADETLTRVARRLEEENISRAETPDRYCYIVARFVFLEHLRETKASPVVVAAPDGGQDPASAESNESALEAADARERLLGCLEKCVAMLDPLNRRIITQYYLGTERVKIDNRRALAESLGLTMNALAIRACRVRTRLEACVRRCEETG